MSAVWSEGSERSSWKPPPLPLGAAHVEPTKELTESRGTGIDREDCDEMEEEASAENTVMLIASDVTGGGGGMFTAAGANAVAVNASGLLVEIGNTDGCEEQALNIETCSEAVG